MQLATHLGFNGNCREAFAFYAHTLGGQIRVLMTWGESPMAGTSGALSDRIMHARLDIDGQYLMGADAPPDHYHAPQGTVMVSISIDEPTRAKEVFDALAHSGKTTMPFQETFWARGFGMCIDRFGIPWMINCSKPESAGSPTRTAS